MTSLQFPDASPNHVQPCFSSFFCGWLPCAMIAFLKAFKQEQFGGDLKGGVSLLFLAMVAVGKDDKHAGFFKPQDRTGFSCGFGSILKGCQIMMSESMKFEQI